MLQTNKTKNGFALYLTLMIVSIVIAVTLSIVELSMQQLKLSVGSKDAEIAFQATSAGAECLARITRSASTTINSGADLSFNCFGVNTPTFSRGGVNALSSTDPTNTHRYQGEFSWLGDTRCTAFDLIVINAENVAVDITIGVSNSLKNVIANYPNDTKTCNPGGICRILAVSGFNKACSERNSLGTLKREMLLEF